MAYSLFLARNKDTNLPCGILISSQNPISARIYVRWFCISPLMQGKHIGTSMLQKLLRFYPNCRGIELYTRSINEDAIKFYRKFGFEPCQIAGAEDYPEWFRKESDSLPQNQPQKVEDEEKSSTFSHANPLSFFSKFCLFL